MKPIEKDMKAMFGQTPDSFTLAMERALAGETPAREAAKPRRLSRAWVVVLITVLALALTTGGYAAAVRLGLIDFGEYLRRIPQPALDVLQSTEVQFFEVGPVTVSLNETIADKHLLYIVCQSRMTDGSDALFSEWYDTLSGGSTPEVLQKRLGLKDGYFGEAAAAYDGPIYLISIWLDIDPEAHGGEEAILDGVYGEDGSMLMARMIYTEPDRVGDVISGELRIRVNHVRINAFSEFHIDSEELEVWEEVCPVEIPVTGAYETKEYRPVGDSDLGWGSVTDAYAEHTPAGVYLYVHAQAYDDSVGVKEIYSMDIRDENRELFVISNLYMGGYVAINKQEGEDVELLAFLDTDELPESIWLTWQGKEVEIR